MTPELWRYLAVLSVAVIFGVGCYVHLQWLDPGPPRRFGYGIGALLALVALAVVANVLSPVPPTIGVKIFAAGAVLIALYLIVVVARADRRHR